MRSSFTVSQPVKASGSLQNEGNPPRTTLHLPVEGMVSPRSEPAVEASLNKLPHVRASASYAGKCVKVEFDRRHCAIADIVERLDALGLRVLTREEADRRKPSSGEGNSRLRVMLRRWASVAIANPKLLLAGAGGACLLAAWLVHLGGGPQAVRIALAVACYVLCGWHTARNTLQTLRLFHFDIDVLMFVAAIGAAVIGRWEEGGMLLLLFAIGNAGEEMALDRARQAIHALAKLAPETATRRDAAGKDHLVPVADLAIGDRVVVRPFDRVPADGVVVEGVSSIDQAPITGESVPVDKLIGSAVFAGTINGEGLLVVSVSRLADESTLAKVVRLVGEAQASKGPTQLFTARIERFYVPLVLLATVLIVVLPPVLASGSWSTWFYRAMAFLTAASPCALAIGTPATVLSGIARAARIGVLIKGGAHLENLGRVRAVALDKTGTLTRGRPTVTEVLAYPSAGRSPDEVLAVAAAVERASSHPLARAIVDEATARKLAVPPAGAVEQVVARGMSADVDGHAIRVGKPAWVTDRSPESWDAMARQGRSLVAVAVDGRPAGVIALADGLRPSAVDAVRRLRAVGVARVIMLTGDHAAVADAIGNLVGVDEVHAALLPEDKSRLITELQSRYGPIAMIGDGVNDAPAMALATVGVAMGGAGTDVALEAADVALMGDDLLRLPDAIALSRASRRIITQNLVIAMGVIGVVAPMAALGFTPLGLAVLLHEGSTVVVVLNALRLLRWKP